METQRVNISWAAASGATFNLEIDAVTDEQHDAANTITEHPVEKGAAITDHIRQNADTISITGTISNTPIHLPTDHAGGARQIDVTINAVWKGYDSRGSVRGVKKTLDDVVPLPLPALLGSIPVGQGDEVQIGALVPGGSATTTVKGFSIAFDRVKDCDQALLKIRNDSTLCRVITQLRTYESMGILNYEVSRKPETGDALEFTIVFQKVSTGSTEAVAIPAIPVSKVRKGAVSKGEIPEEPPEQMSALRSAVTGR